MRADTEDMARGAGSPAVAPSASASRERRPTGSTALGVPFELSTILTPLYLVPVRDIADVRVGSTPCRDFWMKMAAGLDSHRARLAIGSSERAVADAILGAAPSFRAKWSGMLAAAEPELTALARRGVNPNVFFASVRHYGWEWRRGDRGVVSEGCPPVVLTKLAHAVGALGSEECRAATRDADAFTAEATRVAALRASDHPDDIIAYEVNDFDPAVIAASRDGDPVCLEVLRAEAERHAQRYYDGMARVSARMTRRRARGHPPEERVNTMIVLLASVFRALTGQPRFARIGRLLDAASLPGMSAGYFAQDIGRGDRIRQRFYTLRDHPDAQLIESAVQGALAHARRLPKR